MSATAFNMGATAGKVLIDMNTGRDLGGHGPRGGYGIQLDSAHKM